MEYFVNYPAGKGVAVAGWAREKEAEGWHGICASDHLWVGATRYPHVFVTATEMACATRRIRITTSFCNNLFRSPVEFAQAALSLQAASSGRFEAGLGAGWAEDEMLAMGQVYPGGPERVSRYVEALEVAGALLKTGQCRFDGDYYQVDITGERALAGWEAAPPLIGSAGGPRALREVTPLVDRLEIKASARATRGGQLDFEVMATVTWDEVQRNVARVREVSPTIPIGIFMLVGADDGSGADALRSAFGDGYLGRFIGRPADVAQALAELAELGIDRVQLTELIPGTQSRLAAHLL